MRIKTYTAPDLAGALACARAELGPEALVLATREVAGRLGLRSVEVTVAVDPPRGTGPADPGATLLRGMAGRLRADAEPSTAPEEASDPLAGLDHPALETAARALVDAGVSADLALRFARIAARDLRPAAPPADLARAAEQGLAGLLSFAPLGMAGGCVFVIGPPGCGKTTTAAKLAARITSRSRRPVVLATADAERIGAFEQAIQLAHCVGALPVCVESGSQLADALRDAGPRATVLVDTPGVGGGDEERLRYVAGLRDAVPGAKAALLIPAGLHSAEAEQILRRFRRLRPTCVAFSRVDDGGRLGELVTALEPCGLPLGFVTNGHEPPDLEDASPRSLAALLLRGGLETRSMEENRA